MRTSKTLIRRYNERLVTDLPIYVLPRIRKAIRRIWEPGIEVETITFIRLFTGAKDKSGRVSVLIPFYDLTWLGLDPTEPVYLKMYRYPIWKSTHIVHGIPSGRLWIPRTIVDELSIKPNWFYSFQVRGMTPSLEKKIEEEIREITINHLGREYTTISRTWNLPEITGNYRGRDVIPETIFGWCVDKTNIIAQWYYETPGYIYVDFIVEPNNPMIAKNVANHNNLAFRDIALRNYTAIEELDYGFLAEIRSTWLSCYPRQYYNLNDEYMTLVKSLNITVENIVAFFFQFKGEGSHLRYAEKKGKVKYEVLGEEEKVPVSYGEVANFPFNYADKYVRITAHDDEYEYFNERLERDLCSKRFEDGAVLICKEGFIWLRR